MSKCSTPVARRLRPFLWDDFGIRHGAFEILRAPPEYFVRSAKEHGETLILHLVPNPVRDFFARFLAHSDKRSLHDFHINLLELEINRVRYNVFLVPPLFEASEAYQADIAQARRILSITRRRRWFGHVQFDLPHYWLTLLGHRLAVERGLSVGGIAALAHLTSRYLHLPLKETEVWDEDKLFQKYTETALRDEWDYSSFLFRYVRSDWPPETL